MARVAQIADYRARYGPGQIVIDEREIECYVAAVTG
jgi:hypothetical protein